MIEIETPAPAKPAAQRRRVVLLTGMSGAGLSTALKVFEDLGYEAVDNLRLGFVPALLADTSVKEGKEGAENAAATRSLAVAVDTRNAGFAVEELLALMDRLEQDPELEPRLVFLECSDDVLQKRFTETRRRHPLALDRPVTDGIKREREMLWKLRDAADQVIDTSILSIHDLRRLIAGNHRIDADSGLTLFVTSFSYRHGVPREADLVFDARFLANPHWEATLRPLTGQHREVADYIRQDPGLKDFLRHLTALLLPLLPRFQQEGKSYLTVAIGCTGGRHRSVFIAEELATIFAMHGYVTGVGHRDLDRSANKA